jgi:hypothetical protein
MSDPNRPIGAAPAGGTRRGLRAHRSGGGVSRAPIVVGVLALLVVGGLIDRASAPGTSAAATAPPVPVAAPAAALASSWFCGGATDLAAGAVPADIVVVNAGPTEISGTATLIPSQGSDVTVALKVPPESQVGLQEAVSGGSPWIAAVVDLYGGNASVEQQVIAPSGHTSAPCATSGSPTWYFASGATLVNEATTISLLNPYPGDAIVDLSVTTDQGVEQPADFQGMVVGAGQLLVVDLGSHLRRRQFIATTVAARVGRVVAWKTQVVSPPAPGAPLLGTPAGQAPGADPAAPVPGVSVTLGTPSPATRWWWPAGTAGDGVNEQYVIYNPGSATAQVELAITLEQGSAEPFDVAVAPQSVTTIISDQQARIPPGIPHSAELSSLNGVGVVAERTMSSSAPAAAAGSGELFGGRVPADSWLLAAPPTSPSGAPKLAETVVVANPGTRPLSVSVNGLVDGTIVGLSGLDRVTVAAGATATIRPSDAGLASLPPLVIRSSGGPVVVERDLSGTAQAGSSDAALGTILPPLSP